MRFIKKHKIKLSIVFIFVAWFSIASSQKYKYPDKEELIKRVNYLEQVINSPLDNNSELLNVGKYSPEWMLFSLSYTSYALTNISFLDNSFNNRSIQIIDSAIQKILSKKIYMYFSGKEDVSPIKEKEGSVLYLGHLNTMLGCYRLLSNNTKYDSINNLISKSLFERYENSDCLNLCSYPNQIWIPDNSVAIASLKLHSMNTGSNYEEICKKWVKLMKIKYTEPKTKTLYSTINNSTCNELEEPRGSMLGWSIFFIYRFDKDWANLLYLNYKKHFSNNIGIFRLFKERYNKRTSGIGDLDSGPLFLGYSIPANAFAFAGAVAFNDKRNAKRLQRLIKFGSKTIETQKEISYKVRFVNETYSPLAEALLLYFETMTEWKKQTKNNTTLSTF